MLSILAAMVFLTCGVVMHNRQRMIAAAVFAGIGIGFAYPYLPMLGGL